MESFDDFKNLWSTAQAAPRINAEELLAGTRKHQRRELGKGILGIVAMLCSLAVIIWVIFSYNSGIWTTRMGELLIVVAVLAAVISRSRLLQLLSRSVSNISDMQTYLVQLKKYEQQQVYLYSRGITLYFIALSAGFALYLYEFAYRSLQFGIIAYGATFGWILFCWFYLRPRTIRKQTAKLKAQIMQLEKYAAQLDAEPLPG